MPSLAIQVGTLNVTLLNDTYWITSFNGESTPATGTTVLVNGTWGLQPGAVFAVALSGARIEVTIEPPNPATVDQYVLQYSTQSDFPADGTLSRNISGSELSSGGGAVVSVMLRAFAFDVAFRVFFVLG